MSAFNGKRKKYSWLPESNPAALSGDLSPATSSQTSKSDKSEKAARTGRSRTKGNSKTKQDKDKDSTNDKSSESQTPEFIVDSLGITTNAPEAVAEPAPTAAAATAAATTTATPVAAETLETAVDAGSPPQADTTMLAPEASASSEFAVSSDADAEKSSSKPTATVQPAIATSSAQPASSKIRRRPRKDSVDELVRSRFMSSIGAQQSPSLQQQQKQSISTPPTKAGRTSNGSTSRSRKKASDAASANITANVRDALASERSGSAHASPSVMPGSSNPPGSHSAFGSKHRGGGGDYHHHHHQQYHHHNSHHFGNGVSEANTPVRGFSSAVGGPSPRLGVLESRSSFPSYTPFNPRNVTSTLKRGDHGIGSADQNRVLDVTTGENVIVISAGSRWLRIGKASDAVPCEIPHTIARRLKVAAKPSSTSVPNDPGAAAVFGDARAVPEKDADGDAGSNNLAVEDEAAGNTGAISENTESGPNKNTSSNDSSMDVDETEGKTGSEDDSGENSDSESQMDDAEKEGAPVDGDSVDGIVDMLREALKQHQRQSKRKAPPNAYSQVLTYNRQSTPEVIQDHNDPFKIEWLSSSEINEDFVIGEKALRIADSEKFLIRYPIRNGCFNVEDYSSVEEVVGDIEAIWTSVIESELGIKRKDLASYGVVLAIPDIFSRVQVIALSEMLLRRMGFHSLLIQQSSTLVTFGAGFSTACVVDVGAQKTSIACVEDGYCHQESRVNIMCGGDDITRFLFNLFTRSAFPYHEASLQRLYDWSMINELRERHCTLNLSDVNIRMHDFFVRSPNEHTYKYSFKTYDEMYQAPLCLFYPHLADAFYKPPEYEKTFMNACYPETYGEARSMSCSSFTVTQFGILPSRAIESEVAPEAAQIAEAATAPATVPASMPGTPDPQTNANSASAQLGKAVSSGIKASMADDGSKTSPSTPSVPSVTYVPDPEAQHSRMPLDAAITHSISHAGSVDKAKKLYVSVVLVGGGVSFIPGFGEVLASRLMYIRPEYLQGIERADIVSAPRDLDPRVLAWKGGAVLSRLECAKEMWITSKEWSDFGPRLFRDRLLFQW